MYKNKTVKVSFGKFIFTCSLIPFIQGCVVAEMAEFYLDPIGQCMREESSKKLRPDEKQRRQMCIYVENNYKVPMAKARAQTNQPNEKVQPVTQAVELPDDPQVFGGGASPSPTKTKKKKK